MSLIILLYFLQVQNVSGITVPETFWAHKKYNKIISEI